MSQVPDCPRPPLPWILLCPCPLPCFPSLPFFVLQELIREGERLRLEGRENWESAPGHAHDCLCKAAECGNAHALWLLGGIYQYGWLQREPDHAKSLDFYERAAAKDDAYALFDLGEVYQFGGLEQKRDGAKSLDFYERAAAKEHASALCRPGALCRLGEVYEHGWLGEKIDEKRSLDFYERAAAKDDANALSRLGEVYEYGFLKQEPDHAKSLNFYERAAAKDDAYAWSWGKFPELREHEDVLWRMGEVYVRLGEVYEHGQLGQERDHAKSLDFYERAAANEHADALWRLGEVYEHGQLGQERDHPKSLDLYERAEREDSWVDEDACGGGEEGGEGDGTGEMAQQSSALLADPAEPQGKGDGESDGEKAGHSLVAFPLSADPAAARSQVEQFFDDMGPPGQIEEREAGGI